MPIVCTSDEILDGTIPAKELLLKEIYVTDLDRSFFFFFDSQTMQRIWLDPHEMFLSPPVPLSEEKDRDRMVGSYDELVEKLYIFRDGLNDRAIELIKLWMVYWCLDKEQEDADEVTAATNARFMQPYFYQNADIGPMFVRKTFPQLFEFDESIREWHDFNLRLLKTKPIPRFLTYRAMPVDQFWAFACGPYVGKEITEFRHMERVYIMG